MQRIENEKLEKIVGGELSTMAVLGIVAAIVFFSGVIEGIVHPKACNT